MADTSVKATAASALGVSPPFSVNTDLYGYIFRDAAGSVGIPSPRSLKRQLQLMRGRAINLSLFLVGHENDFSGVVTLVQAVSVQVAIQRVRDIYSQENLGVRRLFWRRISMADVGNYANHRPSGGGRPHRRLHGPNDGIDVFYVQSILNAGGWSTTPGPCDKDAKDEMTGAVIELSSGILGILTAHEVGHYLGLAHGSTITNVMGVELSLRRMGTESASSTARVRTSHLVKAPRCEPTAPLGVPPDDR